MEAIKHDPVWWILVGILGFPALFILGLVAVHLVRVWRGKEPLGVFPEGPVATYGIPGAYIDYCERRDGWKTKTAKFLVSVGFTSVLLWLIGSGWISMLTGDRGLHALGWFASLALAIPLYFWRQRHLRQHGSSVSFYREGIANQPKGGRSSYSDFDKAVIRKIQIEGQTFKVISFTYKNKNWGYHYGISAEADLAPLLTLLKEQGLPVEERNEGA